MTTCVSGHRFIRPVSSRITSETTTVIPYQILSDLVMSTGNGSSAISVNVSYVSGQ